MKKLNFNDLVELSVKTNDQTYKTIDISLIIDGETWQAYEVSISNRDLLFFTDKGMATYLIDSYSDTDHRAELYDWYSEQQTSFN